MHVGGSYDVCVAFWRVPDLQTQSIPTLGMEFVARASFLYSEFRAQLLGAILQRSLPTRMFTISIVVHSYGGCDGDHRSGVWSKC